MGLRKLLTRYLLVLSTLLMLAPGVSYALSAGDLVVLAYSEDFQNYLGVAPGDTIKLGLMYFWMGDGTAPDVRLTLQRPAGVDITGESVAPASKTSSEIVWNLGTLENYASGTIQLLGIVRSDVAEGTELKFTLNISGNVTEQEQTNNVSEFVVKSGQKKPDLFVWKMGSMEMLFGQDGFFYATEQDAPTEFTIFYGNFGTGSAPDVVLTDEMPEGFEFESAEPAPTRVVDNVVEWELGTLPTWHTGEIKIRAIPRSTGMCYNQASITTSAEEGGFSGSEQLQNVSQVGVNVVPLLAPVVTQPATSNSSWGDFVITPNPTIQGLSKAGATVTVYEGQEYFSGDDASELTVLGTTIVGANRVWTIQPQSLNESRDYYLYFRAELNGKISSLSQPLHITVNAELAKAGFDMDGYSVTTGDNTVNPGGLGGSTGTIPGEDVIITLRQTAPDGIDADTTLWAFHRLNITVEGDGATIETTVPVSSVKYAGKDPDQCYKSWDFTYIIRGYGAGAKISVSFKPVEYDCSTAVPEYVIGDDIKITEILIDPAGYVYDIDAAGREYVWPEVPPESSLIENATVTAYVRDGDENWPMWEADRYDQVNPQVTDTTTDDKVQEKGYYAFFVPAGQYRVKAQASNYADYASPILTVVSEPIYHNVGMRRSKSTETSVREIASPFEMPRPTTVVRNFPNPFNMSTNIYFVLPASGHTTVTVYNTRGQKVRDLTAKHFPAGAHTISWDGRDDNGRTVSSGAYFAVLRSGKIFASSRMVLLK